MRREKQHARARIGGQNVAARVEAGAVGQAQIHQHQIGTVLRRPFYRIRDGSRFGDHFDFSRLLNSARNPSLTTSWSSTSISLIFGFAATGD